MKKIILIICLLLLPVLQICGQSTDSTSALIDITSDDTYSSAVNLGPDKLFAIGFPSTMTSDTVFIQTRHSSTGAWQDAYYLSSDGTKTRVHIVVDAGERVSVHPLMTFFLSNWIRIAADDPEAADRTFAIYKGTF